MAMDMFLKVDGITGESNDAAKDTVGTIDVLAWSWGVSQSGTMHVAKGGGAGKANVQDLSITKWYDDSSPVLQKRCVAGTHIASAELNVRKAGDAPYVYIKISMTNVLVSSVSTGGSGGEDRLTENVTLNFAEVKVEYFKQGDTGSVEAGQKFTYKISENVVE